MSKLTSLDPASSGDKAIKDSPADAAPRVEVVGEAHDEEVIPYEGK